MAQLDNMNIKNNLGLPLTWNDIKALLDDKNSPLSKMFAALVFEKQMTQVKSEELLRAEIAAENEITAAEWSAYRNEVAQEEKRKLDELAESVAEAQKPLSETQTASTLDVPGTTTTQIQDDRKAVALQACATILATPPQANMTIDQLADRERQLKQGFYEVMAAELGNTIPWGDGSLEVPTLSNIPIVTFDQHLKVNPATFEKEGGVQHYATAHLFLATLQGWRALLEANSTKTFTVKEKISLIHMANAAAKKAALAELPNGEKFGVSISGYLIPNGQFIQQKMRMLYPNKTASLGEPPATFAEKEKNRTLLTPQVERGLQKKKKN